MAVTTTADISQTRNQQTKTIASNSIRFEFEDFLDSAERKLPEGFDPTVLSLLEIIKSPYKRFLQLPKAFQILPIKAYLYLPYNSIIKLYLLVILLSLPTLYLNFISAALLGSSGIAVVFLIIISLGVIIVPFYLSYMYKTYKQLLNRNDVSWLTNSVAEPFSLLYNSTWPRTLLYVSFCIPLIVEVQYFFSSIYFSLSIYPLIALIVLTIIGHFGFALLFYFCCLTIYFINRNMRFYNLLLLNIKTRVTGYTKGHESILTKNTYEVVKVLANTPGLSIQNLGNIPLISFFASIFVVNSLIFLVAMPYLNGFIVQTAFDVPGIVNTIIGVNTNPSQGARVALFMVVLLLAIVISLVLSVLQVVLPLIFLFRAMLTFRTKALIELDPYIYRDITRFAAETETKITIESSTFMIFILRQYIEGMRPSPVNLFRLGYFTILFVVYVFRFVPNIVVLFS